MWQNYPLGFDQVQLLEGAQKIASGNLLFIGPRTGPANMFTGPLIYYITAIASIIITSPFTVIAVSIIISTITFITTYLLLQHYIKDISFHYSYLLLWAVSPFIVYLDRVPWNPNLSFLSSILVFIPLYSIVQNRNKQIDKKDLIFIAIGTFLSYQAHFSGFILIPLIVIFLVIYRQKLNLLFAGLAGLTTSLIPTILFDIKNGFMNYHGLLGLLNSQTQSESNFLNRLFNNIIISIENIGKVIFQGFDSQIYIITGLFILGINILIIINKKNKQYYWPLIWILSFPVFFAFYSGSVPEYYFAMQLPAILMLYLIVIKSVIKQKAILAVIIVLATFNTSLNINKHYRGVQTFGIYNQVQLSKYLHNLSSSQPISSINYKISLGDTFGLKYLLSDITLNPLGRKINISYQSDTSSYLNNFNGLTVVDATQ